MKDTRSATPASQPQYILAHLTGQAISKVRRRPENPRIDIWWTESFNVIQGN